MAKRGLVVTVAAASGNEGVAYTQLITMATFKNAEGESTATLTSNLGKQDKSKSTYKKSLMYS